MKTNNASESSDDMGCGNPAAAEAQTMLDDQQAVAVH